MIDYKVNRWLKYEAMTDKQRIERTKMESTNFMRDLGHWLANELYGADINYQHRLNDILINIGYYAYWVDKGEEVAKCACCSIPTLKNTLMKTHTCHYCGFWLEHLAELRKPMEYGHTYKAVREGGEVISFKEGIFCHEFRGYGGHQFYFRLTENDVVTSNDVWSAGYLPVELRSLVKHRMITTISKEEFNNA